MIQWTLAALLKKRGWSAYRLAKDAGITMPAAYRLADPDFVPGKLDIPTLNKICAALRVQPGAFLKWTSE